MKKLKKVLQKILDCLEESHIEYDQIVMSQQTADIFFDRLRRCGNRNQ